MPRPKNSPPGLDRLLLWRNADASRLDVGRGALSLAIAKAPTGMVGERGPILSRRNNTSWFIRLQVGQRLMLRGFVLEDFLGLGYLRQYTHGGDVYQVLPNGAVVENKRSGRGKMMPSVGLGMGYRGIKIRGKTIQVFARPENFWKAPFNGYYLTHFAINAGIVTPL